MTESETTDFDSVAYVAASTYRQTVLTALDNGPQRPSDIAGDDIRISHVSRSLAELREKGLVELLVSEDVRKGRYYSLTEAGEQAVDRLELLMGNDE